MTITEQVTVESQRSYRSLLGNRELVAMLAARAASAFGDQVARAVLALTVLQRNDGGPVLSALVLAVAYLPLTVGFAALGSLADRFPRRAVMITCDGARALLVAWLAVLATVAPLWAVLVLLLSAELFAPPFAAASQAMLRTAADDSVQFQHANAVKGMLDQVMQVAGFAAAGVLLQLSSAQIALALDAGTFAVSLALVAAFVRPRPSADVSGTSPRRLLRDLVDGAYVVTHTRGLRWLAALSWISAALLVATDGVALPYSVGQGASDAAATALLAATPAGAAVGALAVGRASMARQLRMVLPLAVLSTIPMVVTGFDPGLPLTWVLWCVVGLCQGYVLTVMTLVVVLTPDAQRGRVTGVVAGGFNTVAAVTLLLLGLLSQAVTPAFALSITGSLGLAVLLLVWMMWPTRDVGLAVRATYGAPSRRT